MKKILSTNRKKNRKKIKVLEKRKNEGDFMKTKRKSRRQMNGERRKVKER